MRFKPHNYQQYAISFITHNPITAVLLDMGMGKTAITLMAIDYLMYEYFEIVKVLVICPLRVTRTWRDEVNKWEQLSGYRLSIVTGTVAQRKKALAADADIYIINRENVPWLVDKSGVPFDFDMVVIDELSSFKNHQTARHKALMKVRPFIKESWDLLEHLQAKDLWICLQNSKCLTLDSVWVGLSDNSDSITSDPIRSTEISCIPINFCREQRRKSMRRYRTSRFQ